MKQEIHNKSILDQQVSTPSEIEVNSKITDVLDKAIPKMMKGAKEEDINISRVVCYVKVGRKSNLAQIRNMKSETVC